MNVPIIFITTFISHYCHCMNITKEINLSVINKEHFHIPDDSYEWKKHPFFVNHFYLERGWDPIPRQFVITSSSNHSNRTRQKRSDCEDNRCRRKRELPLGDKKTWKIANVKKYTDNNTKTVKKDTLNTSGAMDKPKLGVKNKLPYNESMSRTLEDNKFFLIDEPTFFNLKGKEIGNETVAPIEPILLTQLEPFIPEGRVHPGRMLSSATTTRPTTERLLSSTVFTKKFKNPKAQKAVKEDYFRKFVNATIPSYDPHWRKLPSMAYVTKDGVFYCHATILTGIWLLSAANCYLEFHPTKSTLGYKKKGTNADEERFRMYKIKTNDGSTYLVKRIIIHSKFNISRGLNNDIALILIFHTIKYSDMVKPAVVSAAEKDLPINTVAIAYAYDITNDGKTVQQLPPINIVKDLMRHCKRLIENEDFEVSENMFCALACSPRAQQEGVGIYFKKQLVAMATSIGVDDEAAKPVCSVPIVYLNVKRYREWIAEIIAAYN